MKQQFLVDKTGTIRLTMYDKNRPIVPASAKITLYKSDGSELQAQIAVTAIDATSGEMTYSLTATHTDDHDLNFKAVWEYISDGVTYYETQLFDVVKSILSIPITDDDIFNELESLRETYKQATGTATAGAAASLTDTLNRKENDNFWKGGLLEIIAGTGDGQKRAITGNTQSTGVVAITPNWATNPDNTSRYRIVRSFYKKIEQGFEKLETMLYNKGQRHSLILEGSQIKFPLLYLTIHHICLDMISEEGDKWTYLAGQYWDKFNNEFTNMKVEYDADESGAISAEEEQHSVNEMRIRRT